MSSNNGGKIAGLGCAGVLVLALFGGCVAAMTDGTGNPDKPVTTPTSSAPTRTPSAAPTTEKPTPAKTPTEEPPVSAPVNTAESIDTNVGTVHPGSYCSPAGATGVSKSGTPMVCAPGSDGRNRWRSA